MYVSKHARQRAIERLGLNPAAFERLAARALELGLKHADVGGRLQAFVDSLYLANRNANNVRIYGEYVYLFQGDHLITVWKLVGDLKKDALKLQKKMKEAVA
jgi:hypothetical protein